MIPAAPGGITTASDDSDSYALRLRGVSKHFGGTQALADAHLAVRKGTVHALLGGNGSGKSTMIKILANVYEADAGELTVFGREYSLSNYSPVIAQEAGLRFVHQDLGLFEELSIEENFALDAGYPKTRSGRIQWKELRARVASLLDQYEIRAHPRSPVKDLRPSDRTMVAIARALQDQDDDELILVLDEPTASLAAHESAMLLEKVRHRADQGQTVVIVSHRLQEVLSVAHDFTVFRDGKVVGELVAASPSEDELIEIMAGGLVPALRPTGSVSHQTGRPVLEIAALASGPVRDLDLVVHAGEIVGVAGLVGSGRSSLLKTVFGVVRPSAGTIALDGEPYAPSHVEDAMSAGIAMVPEDRGRDAAFPDRTVNENIAIAMFREYWARRWMPRDREYRAAAALIRRFGIKADGPDALFSSMSGGNQQKTIIARWLQRDPRVLLLDEPTQGVDVMSRSDIYAVIREAASGGCAVLVASSDLSELHALCDRIVVMSHGRITDDVQARELDVEALTGLVLRDRPRSTSTTPSSPSPAENTTRITKKPGR